MSAKEWLFVKFLTLDAIFKAPVWIFLFRLKKFPLQLVHKKVFPKKSQKMINLTYGRALRGDSINGRKYSIGTKNLICQATVYF